MSISDILIVSVIIIVALVGIIFVTTASGNVTEVKITVNGEVYKEASLKSDKKQVIKINDTNTVVIENGYVYMQDADCKDQLCVKQGKISNEGESIVCLPNKIIVEIEESADLEHAVW